MNTKGASPTVKSRYKDVGDWKESVPDVLHPAVEHLRKLFDDLQFGCGHTTQRFCFAILHNIPADDPDNEYFNYLMAMKSWVGRDRTLQFNDLLRQNRPSATFKAFFDLYLDCLSGQALQIFGELAEVGSANRRILATPHLQWAEAQTSHLIRSHRYHIPSWIRSVCDTQTHDPNDVSDEWIFWRNWQAPMFLIMEPSRYRPYDEASAWERNDADASAGWLELFADHYVLELEILLRKAAGDAALELAKRVVANGEQNATVPQPPVEDLSSRKKSPGARRDIRKSDTRAKHKRWQEEYKDRKKQRPEMSDVWHATQIAKLGIAEGASVETVRKNMKP